MQNCLMQKSLMQHGWNAGAVKICVAGRDGLLGSPGNPT
jgi:hypothetical protein